MKTKLNPFVQVTGSALLVTLFLMTLLAISIAGYMYYVEQQSYLSARSQAWNVAISVSEAGVEEGLQHLNSSRTNLLSDGWAASGTTYTMTRSMADATYLGSYTVTIDASNIFQPVITSKAYVSPPTLALAAPTAFFAVGTVNAPSAGDASTVARGVQVIARCPNFYSAAMVAKYDIKMNGNNVMCDSFDSGDPTKSTNGQWDKFKAGDFGDVASNGGITNNVDVGNANIYGHLYTGPDESATIGDNGGVGSHTWQATHTGFQEGWVYNDAHYTFPETTLPYGDNGNDPGAGDVVTIAGYSTNTIFVTGSSTPPGAPPAGYFLGPVTTNSSSVTTTTYPGPQAGLTVNTNYLTVLTYPSGQPGLVTNYTHFVTTTTNPGSQPGLTMTAVYTNVSVLPDPAPPGTTTNYNGNGSSKKISSYTYPVIYYTYADQFSYTYQTYTYTYPVFTFSYVFYDAEAIYVTNHYDHVLQSGDYYATSLSGSTVVTGNARLILPNGINMSGSDSILVAQGGSLQVWCDGTSSAINGNAVVNQSGYAGNFIVLCTDNVTSFALSGNGQFSGVIVAPNADVSLNGAGTTITHPFDYTGALMAKTISLNGHFNFHYDQALGRMSWTGRYLVMDWHEINVTP